MMHAVIALAVLSPLLARSMPRLEDAQLGKLERNWRGSVPNDTGGCGIIIAYGIE